MSALSGVRVLDLSRVLAGPWASQLLADLGADVVKVERPKAGDDTRGWGPPFLTRADGSQGPAAYYLCANRGKKSITVDITQAEGQQIIKKLIENSDVLIENYKVGGLKKYGLDYESVKAINSKLVYCSITGFGQTGPYADRAGYDYIVQGMTGLMSITGPADGEPHKVGVAVTDLFTGLYASNAILAALHARHTTGEGQHIDVALFDCALATLANVNMNYLIGGQTPPRLGNAHANIVPYQVFPTSDGHFILACGNDAQFARVAELVGLPEWAQDPRFATNAARVQHREVLTPMLADCFRQRTRQDWLSALDAAGVPAGPINTVDEAFADPHCIARQMRRDLVAADGTVVPQVACPVQLSGTPIDYQNPPPELGQHTEEVLTALGWDGAAQRKLQQSGAI